ncbi:MAG TPA: universal stress protein [Solirubrobacteraceae bacterium]|nr:universal stress protein [Solirubrobacteraceae bacterium]
MTAAHVHAGVAKPAVPGPGSPRDAEPPPVVLATLSVRIDPAAERMAIDSALETGARLIIANMLWLPSHPATLMLAREHATLPHEEDLDAVRATAQRAAARGVPTELLRISSRRPLQALIELLAERRAGLVVLGPDPRRSPRWWRAMAARRIRRRAECLVWIAPGG